MCLPPPGFEALLPEQDVPLIGIPNPDGAQSTLMPIDTMNVVVYKNEVTGNLKYEYEAYYLSLCTWNFPNQGPKITVL